MKYKNIVAKKTYTDKSGVENISWNKVGVLKETEDGKQFIEIFAIGEFYVFEDKPKEAKKDDYSQPEPVDDYSQPDPLSDSSGDVKAIDYPVVDEEISVEDIPF